MLHNFTCEEIAWLYDRLPEFKVSAEETYPHQQDYISLVLGRPVLAKPASFSVRKSLFAAFGTDYGPGVRARIADDVLPDLWKYSHELALDKMFQSWYIFDTTGYIKFKTATVEADAANTSKYGRKYTPDNIKQHFAKEAHICKLRV